MQEEDEDEEDLFLLHLARKKNPIDAIFKSRKKEGAFEILIKRHLFQNDKKFKEYFRLSISLFQTVLNYIKSDIDKIPYRNRNPISPEEKLSITLRFVSFY